MTPLLRKLLGMNWVLVLTMYGLLIFGVFAIESAARHLTGGGVYYAGMQKKWIILGTLVYFGAALTDYRWMRWLGPPFYLVSLGLVLAALQKDDAVHQLHFGGFSFQPVQLCVAAGIVLTASLLQDLPRLWRFFSKPFVKMAIVGVLTGIPFLIVVKMGDMGSAIVWMPVALVAMIVSGMPYRHLILLGLVGLIFLPIIYFGVLPVVSERGTERIELYLDMLQEREVDITGVAYAPYYVSMAVGKAGWSGSGWNATAERGSLHAKRFIPWQTAHNDFIFAVIAEEQGFRGSLLLITAFALLLIQCLFVAFYSRDVSGRVLVAGVVALFFAHIFENIGMCVLLMPITGIPLPLISYSGTFVVITMFLLGLVQSVWIHRNAGHDDGRAQPEWD